MTLGDRLHAAHDACRAVLRRHPYLIRVQFDQHLTEIASQYELSRANVSEIMSRVLDQYQPADDDADYSQA